MSINSIILVIFDLVIFCYVVFLIQQALTFKSKYGYLCEASGLGELKNSHHKIYNVGYFTFGLISVFFVYNLHKILSVSEVTNWAITFMYIAGVALCLIAIFPRDTFHREHTFASTLMFLCGLIFMFLLIIPFMKTPEIPKIIIVLNVLIPSLLIYYIYLKIKNYKKYGTLDNDMERFVSIWEWIPFILTYVWYFILNTLLILKLL